jgi:glyoxalase family protein
MKLTGIHHLTAMASDPARNVDFYTRVLGLRLVKKTVNFDDPGTYHLYYGDRAGSPGTILTFFPWPEARKGRPGAGQVTAFAFQIPPGSSGFWAKRLENATGATPTHGTRFGASLLLASDPDGFQIELIEVEHPRHVEAWTAAEVPDDVALHGFHSATLALWEEEPTAMLLTGLMGARFAGREGNRVRFVLGDGPDEAKIDLLVDLNADAGSGGTGIVHHIAWRTPDDAAEAECREALVRAGFPVSPVMDRNYFHSIYYREPGGVLFEIATDPPGFAVDEPAEFLGEKLMLPDWLEPRRAILEATLPPLNEPNSR